MIRIPTLVSIKIPQLERVNIQAVLGPLRGLNKRIFDAMVAFIGLILLLPVFVLIAILIKRDSPGPVFYWGPRVGRNGRWFRILKFRTMYDRPESHHGPRLTFKEDDRITPLGRWLRETKINELPQLWNVLKGEMSLVGPRPEDPEIAQDWPEDTRREILSVRPGITSPASILYHDEEALLSKADVLGTYFKNILPDKMRLDRLYVRNHSFSSDLDTIFWTAVVLIPRMAKVRIPEGYLFAGPIFCLVHRYISWFLIDLVVALGAASTAFLLWRSQVPLNWGMAHLMGLVIILAFLFSGVNSIAGLNKIVWTQATAEDAVGLVLSSGVVILAFVLLDYLQSSFGWLPYPSLPATMIFMIGLMASVGFVVMRYRLRLVTGVASRWLEWRRNAMKMGERVLIVGAGEGIQIANWLLRHGEPRWAISVVGIVDDDQPTRHGMRVGGRRVLGGSADLPALIKQYDVGVVLLAVPNISLGPKEQISSICRGLGTRLVFLPDLLEALGKQLAQPLGAK